MERPLNVWKESSSGLASSSQLLNSSSSMTPAVLDVTPVRSTPEQSNQAPPAVFRSRKEIFEEALRTTLARNRMALDELGKL